MRCQNSLAVLCRILSAPPDCVRCGAPAILVLCVTKECTHISLGKSGLFCANESLVRVLRAVLCAVLRVLQAWELQVQQTQKAWKRTRKLLCAVTVSSNCNLCAVLACCAGVGAVGAADAEGLGLH